jgi:hypothetical protein
MLSICAGKTAHGHVMIWVLIIALIDVVFHGLHDKGQNTQSSFTRGQPPLTVLLVPVIL